MRAYHALGARMHADAGAFDAAALGVASLLALDAGDLESSERWARSALESGQANAEALICGIGAGADGARR